jgi:hypothetical protein
MAGDENSGAIGMTRLVEKNWRNPAVYSQLEPIFKDSEVKRKHTLSNADFVLLVL